MQLPWDSDFFEIKVGKVVGEIDSEQAFTAVEHNFISEKYDLLYYSHEKELSPFFNINEKIKSRLVDVKTTFGKKIDIAAQFDPKIELTNESLDERSSQQLFDLAIQSGEFSRFKIDPKISADKFKRFYETWMVNSLNKSFADAVLVYKIDDEMVGFITLNSNHNQASIGLIAVDHHYRGMGIGKKLIESGENFMYQQGFKTLQVVTQGENIAACRLYEKCGFRKLNSEYFYHFWSK